MNKILAIIALAAFAPLAANAAAPMPPQQSHHEMAANNAGMVGHEMFSNAQGQPMPAYGAGQAG